MIGRMLRIPSATASLRDVLLESAVSRRRRPAMTMSASPCLPRLIGIASATSRPGWNPVAGEVGEDRTIVVTWGSWPRSYRRALINQASALRPRPPVQAGIQPG